MSLKWPWVVCGSVLASLSAWGADWPHWRGPQRDGISKEALPEQLETAKIAWRSEVGIGFASVAVAGDHLVTLGNEDDHDTVWCLNARTGEETWRYRYPCALEPDGHEGGPGATPAIDAKANVVYTMSKRGQVFCFDLQDGTVRWQRDLWNEYGLEAPRWRFSGSPVLWRDRVLLNVGSAGWALDQESGRTLWRSEGAPSGYATPVVIPERDEVIILSAKALVTVSAESGQERWRYPWDGSRVNAADPIVSMGRVLVSSSAGAILLDEIAMDPVRVWQHKALRTYFNPGVFSDGHVYAIHGTTHRATALVCVHLASGETRWSEPGFGNGALMAADGGRELILFDKGQLTFFPAKASAFEPQFRFQVLGGKCWTVPVLANGMIYCRNARGQLACVAFASPSEDS